MDSTAYDLETEAALLGYLMMHNEALYLVSPYLQDGHFYLPLHRRLYAAIRQFVADGQAANPLTLKPYFAGDPDLSDGGGAKYLSQMAGAAITVIDLPRLGRTVHDLYLRRAACGLMDETAAMLGEVQINPSAAEIISQAMRGLEDLAFSPALDSSRKLGDVVKGLLESMANPLACYRTGISSLDISMGGGLYQGRAYGIAARKKTGKTMLCSTISYNLSLKGVPHLFICGEMSSSEIEQRNIARFGNFSPLNFLNKTRETMAMREHVERYREEFPNAVVYEDAPGLTFDRLKDIVSRNLIKNRIKGFILDYWQLVGGKGKSQSTAEHLDVVAQWIADFSRKNGLFAIVAAQINQEGNTRGGEGIRLAFDQVYVLHREEGKNEAWLEMIESRYTEWRDVGSKDHPGLLLMGSGPWFQGTGA